MSFWSTSSGESAVENVEKEYDAGGSFDLIPDGSTVNAFIEEAKWAKGRDEDGEPEYINLKWKVQEPEAVNGRVVFQKLWVKDADPNAKTEEKANAKRDKALRMLASIDANCGGKLAKKGEEPTNDSMAIALTNKMMAITVKVWEMGDATGNWVAAIAPKGKELKVGVVKGEAKKPYGSGDYSDLGDADIPF